MLLSVSYETALVAAATVQPKLEGRGLYLHEIITAADELDVVLIRKRAKRFDLDSASGILHVFNLKTAEYHVVMLWNGRVIETDGTIWEEAGTYLATKHFRAGALIVKE